MNAVAHPELALARKPLAVAVPAELLDRQTSMTKAIALCVQLSGLEPKEVCMTLEIDPGAGRESWVAMLTEILAGRRAA